MRKVIVLVPILVLVFLFSTIVMADDVVNLKWWHAMGGSKLTVLNNLVADFNATHSNIQIEAINTGSYNDTLNKTIAAIKTHTAPNIVQMYEVGTQVMVDSGVIIPFEDLCKEVAKDESFDFNRFLSPIAGYYTVNGKMQSLPFNSSTPLLYYNKDAFREAGLDPNKPPMTFNELKEYAEKLTIRDKNGNITRYGITWGIHSWFVEQHTANQGALLVNNDNGRNGKKATKINLESEEVIKFVDMWRDMVKAGACLNAGRGWAGANQAWESGRTAMMMESTAMVNQYERVAEEKGFELGTAFITYADGGKHSGTAIGGGSLWIIADQSQKELEACWTFLKWLSEAEQQAYWFKGTGYFPVTKEAVELVMNEQFFSKSPNYLTAFLQLLMTNSEYATRGALIGSYPEVRSTIEDAVEQVLQGSKSTEKAMKEAAIKCDKILAEYNSLF